MKSPLLNIRHAFLIALILFATRSITSAHVAADEMAAAATKFLNSLDPEQLSIAVFDFKNEERQNWIFVPKVRQGLTIKKMTSAQRLLAHDLLKTGLSAMGYEKATNIMSLEGVLKQMEGPGGAMVRDSELYYFSIFGKPDPAGTWGWRAEGHHFSANFTIIKGELFACTPSFMGDNPAEVRAGPRKGLRVLAGEEDLGRALVKAFTEEQRATVIFEKTAPKEIITSNKRKIMPLETAGLPFSKMSWQQQSQLQALVKVYIERLRGDLAGEDFKKITKAGWDKVYFAWAGGIEKGDPH